MHRSAQKIVKGKGGEFTVQTSSSVSQGKDAAATLLCGYALAVVENRVGPYHPQVRVLLENMEELRWDTGGSLAPRCCGEQ